MSLCDNKAFAAIVDDSTVIIIATFDILEISYTWNGATLTGKAGFLLLVKADKNTIFSCILIDISFMNIFYSISGEIIRVSVKYSKTL